jgi:hypothetical protein
MLVFNATFNNIPAISSDDNYSNHNISVMKKDIFIPLVHLGVEKSVSFLSQFALTNNIGNFSQYAFSNNKGHFPINHFLFWFMVALLCKVFAASLAGEHGRVLSKTECQEHQVSRHLVDSSLRRCNQLDEETFELEMSKKTIRLDLPMQIGCFVYQYSKLLSSSLPRSSCWGRYLRLVWHHLCCPRISGSKLQGFTPPLDVSSSPFYPCKLGVSCTSIPSS